MPVHAPTTPFDAPGWKEASDARSRWRRGYRLLQGWYRETQLKLPAGAVDAERPERYVVSMLPLSILDDPDPGVRATAFFGDEVLLDLVERRLGRDDWGGLIQEDRLRRNLLTSQGACFNIIGALDVHGHHDVLATWLRRLGADADHVIEVRIEFAPNRRAHFGGGSAFDAWIHYRTADGADAFCALETKYAEALTDQRLGPPRQPYVDWIAQPQNGWRPAALSRCDTPLLGQMWLNTLLAQSLRTKGNDGIEFREAFAVGMSPAHDTELRAAIIALTAEVEDEALHLRWSPFEELLECCANTTAAPLAEGFRARYLDVTPVAHLLDADDPRLHQPDAFDLDTAYASLATAYDHARELAGRGFGTDSGQSESTIAEHLDVATRAHSRPERVYAAAGCLEQSGEDLRRARELMGPPPE